MAQQPTERVAVQRRIARVRKLTRLLDTSIRIPGTGKRIGLDPLLGLVPWAGDAIGAVLSSYLVWESARLGASRGTVARMLLNVAVETVLGVIPVAGDVFDAVWKANTRNLRLLEGYLSDPARAGVAARRFWLGMAVVVGGSVAGMVVLAGWLLSVLLGLIGVI
jgi:hypothetical protein